jgi:hypothetical protein
MSFLQTLSSYVTSQWRDFRQGWKFVGTSGNKTYWIQDFPKKLQEKYDRNDIERRSRLSALQDALDAFLYVASNQFSGPEFVFDFEGDDNDDSFFFPICDLNQIRVVRAIERRRTVGSELHRKPKRGSFRPRGVAKKEPKTAVLYLTEEGLRSPHVLFEEVAHACRRKLRPDAMGMPLKSRRYTCHFDIFMAMRMSPLWPRLTADQRSRIDGVLDGTRKRPSTGLSLLDSCVPRTVGFNNCECDGAK